MKKILLVVGQAGTGKTTWLMQKVKESVPSGTLSEHQHVLAITRMHGARRRLEIKLKETCSGIRTSVMTIDGFALSVLNRWRTALGHEKPIRAVSEDLNFQETIFGTEAGFGQVLCAATQLLESKTINRIIGESFPLIIIDEFQDCHGELLKFIKALSTCSQLFLAADSFQLLDSAISGCPAIEWIQDLKNERLAEITELSLCHRTSVQGILEASRCLRDNISASIFSVPVICCPSEGPAAWKIIEKMIFDTNRWIGTTALICPSHDPFMQKVLNSANKQLQNRNCSPIRWGSEHTVGEEQQRLRANLGLHDDNIASSDWTLPVTISDPIGAHVAERSSRFARLRGFYKVEKAIVEKYVETVVHEKRAYSPSRISRVVTTVHGAKNREFDNVFVLWTHKLPPDQVQQRRLLYNAVTRAKKNCMILVLGSVSRATNDPILSLLGAAQPAFPNAKPKKRSSKKIKRAAVIKLGK